MGRLPFWRIVFISLRAVICCPADPWDTSLLLKVTPLSGQVQACESVATKIEGRA